MAMSAPGARRKTTKITKENVADFMAEVDSLVLDCDGVIWSFTTDAMFPNVEEALHLLRKRGKKLMFVSNNSVYPPQDKFKLLGFDVQEDEVVVPSKVVAKSLKRRDFKGKAFVIGSARFKDALREEGIDVLERAEDVPTDSIAALIGSIKDRHEGVRAVIIDVDVRVRNIDMAHATNYLLDDPECCFYVCASEKKVPFPGAPHLGPGYWAQIVEDASGRKADVVGKPAPMMITEFLKDAHQLDLARSAFVGDSLHQDMGIAHNCGMKKLLVLTGSAKLEDLETCDPNLIPDYYVDSVGDFAELLSAETSGRVETRPSRGA